MCIHIANESVYKVGDAFIFRNHLWGDKFYCFIYLFFFFFSSILIQWQCIVNPIASDGAVRCLREVYLFFYIMKCVCELSSILAFLHMGRRRCIEDIQCKVKLCRGWE